MKQVSECLSRRVVHGPAEGRPDGIWEGRLGTTNDADTAPELCFAAAASEHPTLSRIQLFELNRDGRRPIWSPRVEWVMFVSDQELHAQTRAAADFGCELSQPRSFPRLVEWAGIVEVNHQFLPLG